MLKAARALLAEATQRDIEEIPDDASINTWDGWTSLSHMHLILAIETRLGHELPPEAVVTIATLKDVVSFLNENESSLR